MDSPEPLDPLHFLKTLPANRTGRDFVVGDLHGCFSLLREQLEAVNFDATCDRLFSVGDLIDRGPESFACLELLREPWFHAVLGNHEAMLLTYCQARGSDYHRPRDFLNNGGDWLFALNPEQREEAERDLIPRLLHTPLMLRVEHDEVPFFLVHGERLGRGVDAFVRDADLEDPVDEDACLALQTPLTWGRRLAAQARSASLKKEGREHAGLWLTETPWEPGVGLTYTGHTIFEDHPVLHRSHAFIDRGAYRTVTEAPAPRNTLLMLEHGAFIRTLREAGVRPD